MGPLQYPVQVGTPRRSADPAFEGFVGILANAIGKVRRATTRGNDDPVTVHRRVNRNAMTVTSQAFMTLRVSDESSVGLVG